MLSGEVCGQGVFGNCGEALKERIVRRDGEKRSREPSRSFKRSGSGTQKDRSRSNSAV
jgi:hypothetical protein